MKTAYVSLVSLLVLAPAAAGDFQPLFQMRWVFADADATSFGAPGSSQTVQHFAPGMGPFAATALAEAYGNVGALGYGLGWEDSDTGSTLLLRGSGEALARARRGSVGTVGTSAANSFYRVSFQVGALTHAHLAGELSVSATLSAVPYAEVRLTRTGAGGTILYHTILSTAPSAATINMPLSLEAGAYELFMFARASANGSEPSAEPFEARATYSVHLQVVPAPGATPLLLLGGLAGVRPRRRR
jgi:hypothetical protein